MKSIKHVVVTSIVAAAACCATSAAAAVPTFITHQGRLFDTEGVPITATLDVELAIYDDASAQVPIWSEVHSVTFDDGYFSVGLGDVVPFTQTTFNGSVRYLGIRVGSDQEMTPRARVGSVPYAILANNVNGDITPNSVTVGGTVVINNNGDWTGNPTGLMGPTGPSGAVGPTGAQGIQGVPGTAGPTGAQGIQGVPGAVGPTGPQGIQGAAGAPGAPGAAGPTGPQGLQGAQGAQGIQGAVGPTGPAGTAGAVGPTGPTGVVTTTWVTGVGPNLNVPLTTTPVFIGPQATVSITAAGQKLVVNSVRYLGAGATAATGLDIFNCYQQGAGAVTNDGGGGMYGGSVPANTRQSWAINSVFSGLAVGTYTIGLCGRASSANWTNNEFGYMTVQVVNN